MHVLTLSSLVSNKTSPLLRYLCSITQEMMKCFQLMLSSVPFGFVLNSVSYYSSFLKSVKCFFFIYFFLLSNVRVCFVNWFIGYVNQDLKICSKNSIYVSVNYVHHWDWKCERMYEVHVFYVFNCLVLWPAFHGTRLP